MAICGESGSLAREQIISVLNLHLVDVYPRKGGSSEDAYVIAKDSLREVQRIPPTVPRSFVHYLARKFGIEIHHFYHPS